MRLAHIRYHPECTVYTEGHKQTSGYYSCQCGATSAWHQAIGTTLVEEVVDAIVQLSLSEQNSIGELLAQLRRVQDAKRR